MRSVPSRHSVSVSVLIFYYNVSLLFPCQPGDAARFQSSTPGLDFENPGRPGEYLLPKHTRRVLKRRVGARVWRCLLACTKQRVHGWWVESGGWWLAVQRIEATKRRKKHGTALSRCALYGPARPTPE